LNFWLRCPLASKLDLNAFAVNGFTRKHLVVACFGSWCIVYLGQRKEMNGSEWTLNYGEGNSKERARKRMKDMKGRVDVTENK